MPGGLSVISAVDLAISLIPKRYGKCLIDTCSAFKNADNEISERILRIESCWKRTSLQLDFLGRVWEDLDVDHQDIQNEILTVLHSKLAAAGSKINSFLKERSATWNTDSEITPPKVVIKRFKYASLKEYLDKTIADMESWQKQFDPSWFLIMRIAGQHVDKELDCTSQESRTITTASSIRDLLKENPQQAISVFLPEDGLKSAKTVEIPFTSAKILQRAGSNKWLILDSVSCDFLPDLHQRRKAVRDLARKLTRTDPSTFSLLNCAGVVTEKTSNEFKLVFKTPDNMSDPQTLRASLMSRDINHSLSNRFRLARQLARAVCSLHTFGLVHKSIRPENIILFRDQESKLGSAFLLGLEKVRPEEGRTRLTGDADWEKNLYRHPQRQGLKLQDPYVMQHDIYSLGVCLLEIGLWDSFVQYTDLTSDPVPHQGYQFSTKVPDRSGFSEFVKGQLLASARDPLPRQMGSKYAEIVETCLTCLDEGNEHFGNESDFQDEDGVLVAVRYIEKLSNISV
ncbi:hypothetical protein GP486_004136 [Trichoglossum hirsutum]|uniref:Protein kinase domain-containing protein n=1 Tax=Trichoglossum hirsutum TaxID=265104 RepID=A0A9P8RPM4_9PEZI|nr:hypothetical protein GP486_004136 [Trichoglossum hirsutum]